MKFYLYTKDGKRKKLKMSEVQEHLSRLQIDDAIDAKRKDPNEEVSYRTINNAFIVLELE